MYVFIIICEEIQINRSIFQFQQITFLTLIGKIIKLFYKFIKFSVKFNFFSINIFIVLIKTRAV